MSEITELTQAIAKLAQPAAPAVAIEQTSIDEYQSPECAVRFRKWMAFNGTAYQRGQVAGFPSGQVADLARRGMVDVVTSLDDQTRAAPGMRRAVTK